MRLLRSRTLARLVTHACVGAAALMVAAGSQSLGDMRSVMALVDPRLGKALPEKNYGDVCSLDDGKGGWDWSNLVDRVDVFIAAHLIGWFIKAVCVRGHTVLWLMSFAFEGFELTFRHWLPNFHECWWDHWLLDLLGCNMLGIFLGLLLVRWTGVLKYHWLAPPPAAGRRQRPYLAALAPRALVTMTWLVLLVTVLDLNLFMTKALLWVPTAHLVNTIRTFLLAFGCLLAGRGWYRFRWNGQVDAGTSACSLLVLCEARCWLRWQDFAEPFPADVRLAWLGLALAFALMLALASAVPQPPLPRVAALNGKLAEDANGSPPPSPPPSPRTPGPSVVDHDALANGRPRRR